MAESLFVKADEVSEVLGLSRAEAYRIIKSLKSREQLATSKSRAVPHLHSFIKSFAVYNRKTH